MTDAGSSSTNPELEYLLEFHRRFSSWGISPPRFSEKEQTSIDRFKVASHSAASAPPPPRNTTSVITSALTKCLDFVASFLKITNFFSATKQLKGLAKLLAKLRQFQVFCCDPPLVSAYSKILLWFHNTALRELNKPFSSSSTSFISPKERSLAEKGRDWAAGELASLLGRSRVNELLPNAKFLGFSLEDCAKFAQNYRQQQRSYSSGDVQLDEPFLESIENFLLSALEIFADSDSNCCNTNDCPKTALNLWLRRQEGRRSGDKSNAAAGEGPVSVTNEEFFPERFAVSQLKLSPFREAVLFLIDELSEDFPTDESTLEFAAFRRTFIEFLNSGVKPVVI